MRPLVVLTDFGGLETPIVALEGLQVPHIHAGSSESDKSMREFIARNFTPLELLSDAKEPFKTQLKIDLYVAGPECKNFSSAGLRTGGLDQFHMCVQRIRRHRPRALLLENVATLATRHPEDFEAILALLREDGFYNVYFKILNSAKVGYVPQQRLRIYFLGLNKQYDKGTFHWPTEVRHGGLASILTKRTSRLQLQLPPTTQSTARKNLLAAFGKIMAKGENPFKQQYVLDIDSTKLGMRCNESLCLTKGRGRTGNFYITSEARRFDNCEILRLQAYAPKRIKSRRLRAVNSLQLWGTL